MRTLVLVTVLFTAFQASSCVVLLNVQDLERRLGQIAQTIEPLDGETKEVVFERIQPLELGEPVRIEQISRSREEYEYHRRYLGGGSGYDQVTLFFEDGRLVDYQARARRYAG